MLDADHDGAISREELRTAIGGRLPYAICKLFKAVDTNHDGKLDKDELSRSEESLFWFLLGDRNSETATPNHPSGKRPCCVG